MFSIDSIDSMINSSTNTKLHRFNYMERGLGCIKMGDLVRIHVNDLDNKSIINMIENNKLFLFCREYLEDDFNVYCTKGTLYPVMDFTENSWLIQGDIYFVEVEKTDPEFVLVVFEGGEN